MSLFALGCLVILVAGSILHGRLVARWEGLDDGRPTPAVTREDGAVFVPAWLLLQPRGYLGGFVLFMALAIGVIGIFFSGTTSKQLARETDCRSVGHGAMLMESFVAVIALGTIMVVADTAIAGRSPGRIYGDGLGAFTTALIGHEHPRFAATFGEMAFSTFIFDAIDVATRLGRLIVEEFLGWTGLLAGIAATSLTLLPMIFVLTITTWPLVAQMLSAQDLLQRVTAAALVGLAALMVVEGVRALSRGAGPGSGPQAAPASTT